MTSVPPPPHTQSLRVLIVEDDTLVGLGLKATLERMGHRVAGHAATAAEAVALFESERPDLVLLDLRLGSDTSGDAEGIELARRLGAIRPTPVVVISAYSDPDLVKRASTVGVYGYLVKPVTPETLAAQIEIAMTRSLERERLVEQNAALTHALETRKLVERAKGVLMKRLSLSEEDAHRRLQMESQKRRMALQDLAKKIIESNDLLS